MSKIKDRSKKKSTTSIIKEPMSTSKVNYPVFCLRHLHRDYGLDNLQPQEKAALMDRLYLLCKNFSWDTIRRERRHGYGYEKISLNNIKKDTPSIVTPEIDHLYAFRFCGMKPFVGLKIGFVFHIMFIDNNYTLYEHE